MTIFSGSFWKDTAERTIRGGAQGVVLGLGAAQFTDVGKAVSVGEAALVSGAGIAVLTFFTCLAAGQVGDPATASFSAPADAGLPVSSVGHDTVPPVDAQIVDVPVDPAAPPV